MQPARGTTCNIHVGMFVFELTISNYVCVYTLYFLYADFFENLLFAIFWSMEIARRPSECSRSVCQTTQQFAPATHATSTHAQAHTRTDVLYDVM